MPLYLFSQVPWGFNYQAVARDEAGQVLRNNDMTVRLGIRQGGAEGVLLWQEDHEVTTNDFGLFNVVIGDTSAVHTGGTLSSFRDIVWSAGNLYLETSLGLTDDGVFMALGTSPILAVPLAYYARSVGSLNNLEIRAPEGGPSDSALFVVRRADGQTVFAVYPEGVRVYVDTSSAKGPRGGFIIGGFGPAKGGVREYLRVTPDSVRIYIDPSDTKRPRGGFAIGGYGPLKGAVQEYLRVTDDSTRVYVNDLPDKGPRGGFAIGGFGALKTSADYMKVTPDSVRITTKAVIGEGASAGGTGSASMGFETHATGNYSMAMGYRSEAIAAYTTAMGRETKALGIRAFSGGYGSQATGESSVAIGHFCVASGNYSLALGFETNATGGTASMATGYQTTAGGLYSFTGGRGTSTSGSYSMAMGYNSQGNGTASFAFGSSAIANGNSSIAAGNGVKANANLSAAFNYQTQANGLWSFSTGNNSKANGRASFVSGMSNEANGWYAADLGYQTTAQAYASLVIGRYNVIAGDTGAWAGDDPLLVAGNGTSSSDRSNAMTLYQNGNLTIAGTLTEGSDQRLKHLIEPFTGALAKIEEINAVSYEFKNSEKNPGGVQIGLLAQEVEKTLPELVSRDGSGYLSVSYSRLSAVLLQAIKEQQDIINKQNERILRLEKENACLEKLKARISDLETIINAVAGRDQKE